MTRIWTFAVFGFCLWILRPVLSTRCLSCQGLIDSTCESVTSEVECPQTHDSCFTVTRIMDYPVIGRFVEMRKNCSILQDCWFIRNVSCYNAYGFVNSCSIDCCIGDLCNNKTVQIPQNSTTRVIMHTSTDFVKGTNIKREVTHTGAIPKATQAPRSTSGVSLMKRKATHAPRERSFILMRTPVLSTQYQSNLNGKAFASWTSQRSQASISNSNIPTNDSSREVRADHNHSKGLRSQLLTQVLMVVPGIIFERF